jgi:hypothetical protein
VHIIWFYSKINSSKSVTGNTSREVLLSVFPNVFFDMPLHAAVKYILLNRGIQAYTYTRLHDVLVNCLHSVIMFCLFFVIYISQNIN